MVEGYYIIVKYLVLFQSTACLFGSPNIFFYSYQPGAYQHFANPLHTRWYIIFLTTANYIFIQYIKEEIKNLRLKPLSHIEPHTVELSSDNEDEQIYLFMLPRVSRQQKKKYFPMWVLMEMFYRQ